MRTPADLVAAMLQSDQGRPRVTFYEDTPGPSQGERIELSARVLDNWVSKAANCLQDEYDIGPGATVRIDLPAHWRALYWALAAWSVGASVALGDGSADRPAGRTVDLTVDLTVTDDPEIASAAPPAVLVTLAALARSAPEGAPPGSMDEARELATFGDQFEAYGTANDTAPALVSGGEVTAYDAVVPERDWPEGVRVHTSGDDVAELLRTALAAFAADGSVVVSRGASDEVLEERLRSEGVTLRV
jgi:uncharacterized protein (TIGR03089 family)